MKPWLKTTLIVTTVLAAGGGAWYFISKAKKRANAYNTSVPPSVASKVIGMVNTSVKTPNYV